jgi:mono/diheme cytochrome c family protein
MTKMFRSLLVLAAVVCIAGAVGFAQSSGEAVYKAHCQMCHGPNGVPSPGMVKMMGVPAATDPAVKKMTVEEMIASVKNGKGKMPAFSGKISDEEIRDVVTSFRKFLNPQPLPPG